MATSAASLPPGDDDPQARNDRRGPVEQDRPTPDPPPGLAAAPVSSDSNRRPRRAARTVDLERVRRLADGSSVVVTSRLRWWITLLIAALFIGPLALGGMAVYHSLRNARDRSTAPAPAPAEVVASPLASAVENATATTVAAPTTIAALLPLGATSLFDAGVATALAPLLDQALAGEPTQFTSIAVHPDFAIATTGDRADPTRTQRFAWRPAGLTADAPKQEPIDLTRALFTVADVDWSVLSPLVAAAPGLAGDAGLTVSDVVVQRWGFDPAFPMRVLVYLSTGAFVEAAADGTVIAVH